MQLKAGTQINGRYDILAVLGEGGFASVYHAFDRELGRDVALKILKFIGTAEDEASDSERFRREALLIQRLDHKNISKIFSIDFFCNSPMIVMEYLKGKTLQELLSASNRGLEEQLFDSIFEQVVDGLSCAHALKIIHRDISPPNIFLADDGTVKLIDFGLAKLFEPNHAYKTLTNTGSIMGNPMYMSPEQAKGDKLDQRSDIYSLGCVMYHCITGKPPFAAQNFVGLLYQHEHEYPAEPENFGNSELSLRIKSVLLKCLQKDKSKRFACMDELKEALFHRSQPLPTEKIKLDCWKGQKSVSKTSNNSLVVISGLVVCLSTSLFLWFQNSKDKNKTAESSTKSASLALSSKTLQVRGLRRLLRAADYPELMNLLRQHLDNASQDKEMVLEIIEILDEAIKRHPGRFEAYQLRGIARQRIFQSDLALADLCEAIRLQPNSPVNYFERATVYQSLKNTKMALADYDASLHLSANYDAYFNRGILYLDELHQPARAVDDLSMAVNLAPTSSTPYVYRAQAYRALNRLDTALKDCNQAIKLDGTHTLAWKERAQVYWDLGKEKEALADCDHAINLPESWITPACKELREVFNRELASKEGIRKRKSK